MVVCCPTTTQIKAYPFEVATAGQPPSVVLAELAEVRAKLKALIG